MRKNTYSEKKAGVDDCCGKGVVNIEPELPSWFSKGCLPKNISTDSPALLQYLNACRQVIYPAASLYHDHIKYVTTVLVALLTAMITLFSFLLKLGGVPLGAMRTIEVAGAALMVLAGCFGIVSRKIINRYHMLYIATLLYATEVHYAAGINGFQWFKDIIELLKKKNTENKNTENKEISREEFIQSRSRARKYGHFGYSILILLLISVCFLAAILLVLCAWKGG